LQAEGRVGPAALIDLLRRQIQISEESHGKVALIPHADSPGISSSSRM
jgi:hypothetical protein